MSAEPHSGDVFAGFLLEREIGRGGMGVVFRAREIALDRPCAVKVIAGEHSADPVFSARFRRESRIASAVEHPNIVPVYGAGETDGRLYLVMRAIDGTDLARLLESGPLDPERAITLLRQIAAGLDVAHGAGLVHRDVKPANVLVEATPEGEHAYLTDFGISKLVAGEGDDSTAPTGLTRGGEVIGTADYVAPEQVEEGLADARSDVYSLACVAYATLTGSPPFTRDTELSTLIAHTKAPRPDASKTAPWLKPAVGTVLKEGMAIDPEERPGSAGELIVRLDRALQAAPVQPGLMTHRMPRRRYLWVGALILLATVAAFVLVLDGGGGAGEQTTPSPSGRGVGPVPHVTTGETGSGPVGVAVGDLRLWVASRDGNSVDRLRLGNLEPYSEPTPLQAPRAVTVGFGSIWVVNREALYRLDPGQGTAPRRIDVGSGPDDVAVDGSYVWVSDEDSNKVTRVDPTTDVVTASVDVPDEPRSIATGGGAVWVVSSGDPSLTKIDPAAATVEADPAPIGIRPTSVAFGGDRVWIADNAASKLYGVDPGSDGAGPGAVAVEARTSASPRGVAVGLGAVWVAAGAEDRVDRFDPDTAVRIGSPIDVGGNPADIAVGAGAAYTADFDDATVTRIEP